MHPIAAPAAVDSTSAALPPQLALLASVAADLAKGVDDGLSAVLARTIGHFGAIGGAIYEPTQSGQGMARRVHVGPVELPARLSPDRRDILSVPLRVGDTPVGVLALAQVRPAAADAPFLAALANQLAWALHARNLDTRLREQDGLRQEVDVVAELQRSLLPRAVEGHPVFGLNRPVRRVSGDFFDYFALPGGRLPFALGDVSGKGINAALLMAKTVSLFRCLAKTIGDPTELLRRINGEICETATRGMFVTMVTGVYEPTTGLLRLANAGHEPPLLRYPDRSYKTFPADVPPLGILPDLRPATVEAAMGGGEFYAFSDGLIEFRYDKGEQLGVDGLIQLLECQPDLSQRQRVTDLLAELDRAGWEARDDLTILAIDDSLAGRQP